MVEIRFAGTGALTAPALAVGVQGDRTLRPSGAKLPLAVRLASRLDAVPRFNGEEQGEGEVLLAATETGWLALVGMGEADGLDASRLRAIGGAIFAELAGAGIAELHLALDLGTEDAAELALGLRLRSWRQDQSFHSKPDPAEAPSLERVVVLVEDEAKANACFALRDAVAQGVALARDLTALPGNILHPQSFAERLTDLALLGVGIEILDARALEKRGLNLLLAVGKGSAHPPLLAILRWRGGTAEGKPLVLVGKGITFDTGGLCIKDDEDMDEMKTDMGGAAAVVGAIHALARAKAPVVVTGILAIAENMPSGRSARPGDVVAGFSGLKVEIVDTDAEGRLVLADALAYAGTQDPLAIIDLATLTGAVEVTLGHEMAGLFANDDALARSLVAAGEAVDERLWRLPLTDYYDEALRSAVADIRSCSWDDRAPDALHAARFLEHFVPEGVPWAHLDIAGMALAEEDWDLGPEGPTGFGVRLLDHLVRTRSMG